MASINKRTGGKGARFQALVRRAGHATVCKTFGSLKQAQAWAAMVEGRIDAGSDGATRPLSFVIDAYRDSDAGARLGTYEESVLEWWEALIGTKRLLDLRQSDIYAARDSMTGVGGRALRPATQNRRVAILSAVLTWCVQRGWIDRNVCRIRKLAENNQCDRTVPRHELDRVLAACQRSKEPALYSFALVALCSGARAGELQRLKWRDVDLNAGIAVLAETKSKKPRRIPIQGAALEQLRQMQKREQPDGSRLVFVNRSGSAPFCYARSWREAVDTAGVTMRFHDLRHIAASNLASAGASTIQVMSVLGHASPGSTARYVHLSESDFAQLGKTMAAQAPGVHGNACQSQG